MCPSSSAIAPVCCRPGVRTLARLLLVLLVLQAGAQWCAAQCGISAAGGSAVDAPVSVVGGHSGAGGDVVASSSSDPTSLLLDVQRSEAVDAPCALAAWCELGHASLLPAAHADDMPGRASAPIRSPEAGPVLFLTLPGDRPPTA